MSDIDWSEAPEATHYDSRPYVIHTFMRKTQDGCEWEFLTKDGEWRLYGPMSALDVAVMTARPSAWTGEGLPPVGTVCEFRRGAKDSANWHSGLRSGMKVEILAHYSPCFDGDMVAVFAFEDEPGMGRETEQAVQSCFHPIRTSEQIAEESRDREIADLYFTINWNEGRETWPIISSSRKADYAKAIDAGYRRFEITDDSDPA